MLEIISKLVNKILNKNFYSYLSNNLNNKSKYIKDIGNKLDKIINLEKYGNYLFLLPPRHGKTSIFVNNLIPYYLEKNPNKKVGLITRTGLLGEERKRTIFENIKNKKLIKNITILRKGEAIHGRTFDLLIVDEIYNLQDNIKEEMFSNNSKLSYLELLNSKINPYGSLIIVSSKYKNYLEKIYKNYTFTMYCSEKINCKLYTYPSIEKYETNEALWPKKYTLYDLLNIREMLGKDNFNIIYQQY